MIEFVTSGYIELWKGDLLVSRHRLEREAIESASRAPGRYQLRYPPVWVEVQGEHAEAGEINASVTL